MDTEGLRRVEKSDNAIPAPNVGVGGVDGNATTTADAAAVGAPLPLICCSGYVLYTSDGSPFHRSEVLSVGMRDEATRRQSRLAVTRPLSSRTGHGHAARRCATDFGDDVHFGEWYEEDDDDDDDYDNYGRNGAATHVCVEDATGMPAPAKFVVSNRCNGWSSLTDTQRGVLAGIQRRVDSDRAEGRRFTCVIVEGPGGCGKTRLMAHIMNHKQPSTQVLYVTKQNKRVQDFVHSDCLGGEPDPTVTRPTDLTGVKASDVNSFVWSKTGGRFALTAEKLVYALTSMSPRCFSTEATAVSLDIDYRRIVPGLPATAKRRRYERVWNEKIDNSDVVVLMDEYTMLQPPLIHSLAYHVMRASGSRLLMILAGDKHQCGPVGWDAVGETTTTTITTEDGKGVTPSNADDRFTGDVRREFVVKMNYTPLELPMENLVRCRDDPVLGACVKRLRSVCEAAAAANNNWFCKNMWGSVLAGYSVASGVHLFRCETRPTDVAVPSVRRVVPLDVPALPVHRGAGGRGNGDHGDGDGDDDDEIDERGVSFDPAPEPPFAPAYDLLPLVEHFVTLYTELAALRFTCPAGTHAWRQQELVCRSAAAIRDRFPVFIVLTNGSCNTLAETFQLALYTQLRTRLLGTADAPAAVPPSVATVAGPAVSVRTWTDHVEYTLRRCVRRLTIDEELALRRQTLFVGMIYKMTSTFHTAGATHSLCNGERVVLISLLFEDRAMDRAAMVVLRKLDGNGDTDFTLSTGRNKNRMTGGVDTAVMPFVPFVSENIYQMQGNTMPARADCFIDVVGATCKNVYVAVSRFRNSASIRGIVFSD